MVPQSSIAEKLARLCCFGLNDRKHDWNEIDLVAIKGLLNNLRNLNMLIPREMVLAVVRTSLSTHNKMDLLAAIGGQVNTRESWFFGWDEYASEVNQCCVQIVSNFSEPLRQINILKALSFLPPLPFVAAIPFIALDSYSDENQGYEQITGIFSSNSLRWNLEDAEDLAVNTLGLRTKYPHHLGELLEFMDTKGANGLHLEAYLIALVKNLTLVSDLSLKGRISQVLAKLVERRPAANLLPDPSASKPSTIC